MKTIMQTFWILMITFLTGTDLFCGDIKNVYTFVICQSVTTQPNLASIATEVGNNEFLARIVFSMGGLRDSNWTRWRKLRLKLDPAKVSDQGKVSIHITGGADLIDERERVWAFEIGKIYVVSRCLSLSASLARDRCLQFAIHKSRGVDIQVIAERELSPAILDIAAQYCVPATLLKRAPTLRKLLSIGESEASEDYVLADGEHLLWFNYQSGICSCNIIDRLFVVGSGASEWVSQNQDLISVREAELLKRFGIDSRADRDIVAAEMNLHWIAISELLKELGILILTPADFPDLDEHLKIFP